MGQNQQRKYWKYPVCLSVLLLAFLLLQHACTLGDSKPCESTEDCSEGLVCFQTWCVPAWFEEVTQAKANESTSDANQPSENKAPHGESSCKQVCTIGTTEPCYQSKGCDKDFQCQGTCKAGKKVCLLDSKQCPIWSKCLDAITPRVEECNGKDDDCNGKIDDQVTKECFPNNSVFPELGECRKGTKTCENGIWGSCKNSIKPTIETCNGKDDDCDGKIDNFPSPTVFHTSHGKKTDEKHSQPFIIRTDKEKNVYLIYRMETYPSFLGGHVIFSSNSKLSPVIIAKLNPKKEILWMLQVFSDKRIALLDAVHDDNMGLYVLLHGQAGELLTTPQQKPLHGMKLTTAQTMLIRLNKNGVVQKLLPFPVQTHSTPAILRIALDTSNQNIFAFGHDGTETNYGANLELNNKQHKIPPTDHPFKQENYWLIKLSHSLDQVHWMKNYRSYGASRVLAFQYNNTSERLMIATISTRKALYEGSEVDFAKQEKITLKNASGETKEIVPKQVLQLSTHDKEGKPQKFLQLFSEKEMSTKQHDFYANHAFVMTKSDTLAYFATTLEASSFYIPVKGKYPFESASKKIITTLDNKTSYLLLLAWNLSTNQLTWSNHSSDAEAYTTGFFIQSQQLYVAGYLAKGAKVTGRGQIPFQSPHSGGFLAKIDETTGELHQVLQLNQYLPKESATISKVMGVIEHTETKSMELFGTFRQQLKVGNDLFFTSSPERESLFFTAFDLTKGLQCK